MDKQEFIDEIERAIEMVDQVRHIVDTVVDSTDGHFLKANYEAYGKYGFDQLLSNGNPYDRGLQDLIDRTEEEKRIFFVALTRAKNLIYATCAEKRLWNGKPIDTRVSDFLNKLDYDNPDNLDIDFEIEHENGSTN